MGTAALDVYIADLPDTEIQNHLVAWLRRMLNLVHRAIYGWWPQTERG